MALAVPSIDCLLSDCHRGDSGYIVLVGFAVDKVALGEAYPRVCDFAPVSVILPLLYELGARLAAAGPRVCLSLPMN